MKWITRCPVLALLLLLHYCTQHVAGLPVDSSLTLAQDERTDQILPLPPPPTRPPPPIPRPPPSPPVHRSPPPTYPIPHPHPPPTDYKYLSQPDKDYDDKDGDDYNTDDYDTEDYDTDDDTDDYDTDDDTDKEEEEAGKYYDEEEYRRLLRGPTKRRKRKQQRINDASAVPPAINGLDTLSIAAPVPILNPRSLSSIGPLLPSLPSGAVADQRAPSASQNSSSSPLRDLQRVVVFGDSLVDTGNVFRMTGGAMPSTRLYFSGRFSNGPVWTERLVEDLLHVPLLTYAYGGAVIGASIHNQTVNAPPIMMVNNVPTVYAQVINYVRSQEATNSTLVGRSLHVLHVGANDFAAVMARPRNALPSLDVVMERMVATIMDTLPVLVQSGARHVALVGMPMLDPMARQMRDRPPAEMAALAQWWRTQFDSRLRARIAEHQQRQPKVRIYFINTTAFEQGIVAQREALGLRELERACLNADGSSCAVPDSYFLWDGLHPTRRVHQLFAQYVHGTLSGST